MSTSPWTTYKCAKMPFHGRVATNGEVVRLRIAEYGEAGFFADISFDVPVAAFQQIIAAANLIGITGNVDGCILEKDDFI